MQPLPQGDISYTYDSANQLIRENNQAANKTWTWEYDGGGNILCKKEYAYTTGALGTPIDTIEYGYDYIEWGQLLSSYDGNEVSYGTDNDFSHSVYHDGKYEYVWEHGHQLRYLYEFITEYYYHEYYFTYDANGMRTKMVRETSDLECDQYWKDTYEYTYNGTQLTRMTYEGEAGWYTLDFRYDADGTPVSVTFEHVAHEPDMENGGYLDESSAYDCCIGTYYYITNLQGDVIALVDEYGELAGTYTYDAWGNIIARNSQECIASANPLRYRSYVYDTQTGFYYLQSRYYDPVKGRFISPDGQISGVGGEILGNNQFAYCFNNPVNMSDHSGNWPKWLSGALNVVSGFAQGALGAVIGATVGWTGVGAVAAAALVLNGAATATQGIGQIVNAATKSNVMREDNIVRTGVQHVGGAIGGDVGSTVAGMVYDTGMMVAALYSPTLPTSTTTYVSRGSTATRQPSNLTEKLALEQVMSNPQGTKLPITLKDPRWPAAEGWVKMQQVVPTYSQGKITIHYVYNEVINVFDNFKLK